MKIDIKDADLRLHEGANGHIGFLTLKIGGWLSTRSILVFSHDGVISFSTPAKELRNGVLVPFFEITDAEVRQQIIAVIKEKLAEADRTFVTSQDDEK